VTSDRTVGRNTTVSVTRQTLPKIAEVRNDSTNPWREKTRRVFSLTSGNPMTTMESQSRALAAIISARARPVPLIVICHTYRLAYRASPENTNTLQERMEISPPPLFLYQTTTFSWPYSLGTLPIQTRTQTIRRVLESNQRIVSIARPCIELENYSPPPIRPPSLATTMTKMPADNPYTPYISCWRGS